MQHGKEGKGDLMRPHWGSPMSQRTWSVPSLGHRSLVLLLIISLLLTLAFQLRSRSRSTSAQTACGTTNVARSRPALASSTEGGYTAGLAVDGNTGTRWGSAFSNPQWLRVDLGSTQSVCRVQLRWENAYGRAYQIQTSNDGTTWATIYSTTTGDGGIDNLTGLAGSGRYVRMYGTTRA